jgi:hypothetical protein
MTTDEELELILMEAITEEINKEIIKSVKDPTYQTQMSPMTFETPELKETWTKAYYERREYLLARRAEMEAKDVLDHSG